MREKKIGVRERKKEEEKREKKREFVPDPEPFSTESFKESVDLDERITSQRWWNSTTFSYYIKGLRAHL